MLCGADDACVVCNTSLRYASNGRGGCDVVYVQFCAWQDDFGICHACDAGWLPALGSCKQAADVPDRECLRFGCDNRCVVCRPGRYANAQGRCVPLTGDDVVVNCVVHDAPGVCRECARGFFPVRGRCLVMPPNCIAPASGSCKTCPFNSFPDGPALVTDIVINFWRKWIRYQLFGVFDVALSTTCTPNTDRYCLIAASPTLCVRCQPKYYVDANGRCQRATPEIDHCLVLFDAVTCERCEPGFYVLAGKCASNPRPTPHCRYYASPTLCARCEAPFYLADITATGPEDPNYAFANANYKQCVRSGEEVLFCDWYAADGVCAYCLTGFYLVGNECKHITFIIEHCAVYSRTACLFCETGFYLTAARLCEAVVPPLEGCYRNASQTTCLECGPGYVLQRGLCARFQVDLCWIFNANGVCLYCRTGYFFDGITCRAVAQPPILFCEIFSDATTCLWCQDNFSYNRRTRRCEPTIPANCEVAIGFGQCLYCMAPLYFDPQLNACVQVRRDICDCERYSPDQQCLLCGSRKFINANGQCQEPLQHIDHCYAYLSETACLRCLTGFYVSADKKSCVPIPRPATGQRGICGCVLYASAQQCVECEAGKFLFNNRCEDTADFVANCRSYIDGACVRCDGDRYLANDLECVPVPQVVPYCFFYGASGACTLCDDGYIIDGQGQCRPGTDFVEGCRTYSLRAVCLICEDGRYLKDNQCYFTEVVALCARYSDAVTCEQCLPTFYLERASNRCSPVGPLDFCKYSASLSACAICLPDYRVVDGVCELTDGLPLCAEYDAAGKCVLCEGAFYLNRVQNACRPIQVGIEGCAEYYDAFNCKYCDNQHFLLRDTDGTFICAYVLEHIDNCAVYATATTCRVCDNSEPLEFLLAGKPYTFYALTADGKKCLANCQAARGDKCERCAPYTALVGDACVRVLPAIEHCMYYISPTQCEQCETGFSVTADGRCALGGAVCDGTFTGAAVCAVCETGYAPGLDGVCRRVTPAVEGCLLYTAGQRPVCALCDLSHYHAALNGLCQPVSELIEPPRGPGFIEELVCAWKTQE